MIRRRWQLCVICAALAMLSGAAPADHADVLVDYLRRLNALQSDDADGRLALARWCDGRGLTVHAADLYRQVLDLRPNDAQAYQQLVKLGDRSRLPESADTRKVLAQQFGADFTVLATNHFLVVYNTDPAWAQQQANLLERTHQQFYLAVRGADLRALPLTDRLVCVLFDRHADFARYARSADGVDMGWSAGYYSTRTNRVAFYNDRSNPALHGASSQLRQAEQQVDQIQQQLDEAVRKQDRLQIHRLRSQLARTERLAAHYRQQQTAAVQLGNTAKTAHEAAHQLAYNSGLMKRGALAPFWLSEGLATNFEPLQGHRRFGPQHDNPRRRRALVEARDGQMLTPLGDFVTLTEARTQDAERLRADYAQAWGLFHYLFQHRHNDLRRYLQAQASIRPGRRTAEALRDEFAAAFGRMGTLEDQWMRWVRRLQ